MTTNYRDYNRERLKQAGPRVWVEAVTALLEGRWKWQERYTLGQQLVEIAGNLITKQAEKWKRAHPAASQS